MPLTKVISHDCQVLEDGQIQVREITRVMEDGVELSKTFHRHVVDVGDDTTGESELVRDVAQNLHTPARIARRNADAARRNAELARNGRRMMRLRSVSGSYRP